MTTSLDAITEPGYLPIGWRQGDKYALPLHFVDDDDADVDFSTFTFRAQCRARSGSAALAFTVDDASAADGRLILHMDSATSRKLPAEGVWDLEALDVDGEPITLLAGPGEWPRDVSKP